jgi:hypothetical protein
MSQDNKPKEKIYLINILTKSNFYKWLKQKRRNQKSVSTFLFFQNKINSAKTYHSTNHCRETQNHNGR